MLASSSKYSLFEKTVNFILPCCTILQTYGWGKFDFSFIIVLCLALWGCIKNGRPYLNLPRLLKFYLWYYLLPLILAATSLIDLIPLGWIRLYVMYGLFFSVIDLQLMTRYYSRLALFCILFFLIQLCILTLTGVNIPGVTDSLPLAIDVQDKNAYFEAMSSVNARACSFFSEPAHFAQFLFPLLIIKLFGKKTKKDLIFIIGIISTLLLLKSGNAVLGLTIIILCYSFWIIKEVSVLKKILLVILIPIVLIGGTIYYINSEVGQELLLRQDQLNNDANATSGRSGFVRIYRGYYVYDELSPLEKLIGANNPDLIRDAIAKSKVAFLFARDDLYFNTVQNALIRTGIIGSFILFLFYLSLFRRGNIVGKTTIITLFVIGFISALYLTEIMLLYLIISYRNNKQSNLYKQ